MQIPAGMEGGDWSGVQQQQLGFLHPHMEPNTCCQQLY